MKQWPGVMLVFWTATLALSAENGPAGKMFPAPKGGADWHDAKTGLAFPASLAEMRLDHGFVSGDAALGTQLRFADVPSGARADIFVYPCGKPAATLKEREKVANAEVSEMVGQMQQMEAKGLYRGVKWDEGFCKPLTLADETQTAFISVPIHFEVLDKDGRGSTPFAVSSLAGVLVYHDQYVKLRYTLPADAKPEARTQRDEFVAQLLRCVLDATLRERMVSCIAEYRHDPLSDVGRNAAAEVVMFSDKSPLVNVVIGSGVVNFAKGCKPESTDVENDVMRAFIVGAADAALQDKTEEAVVQSGTDSVKTFCERMVKANGSFSHPSLEQFEAAVLKDNQRLLAPSRR